MVCGVVGCGEVGCDVVWCDVVWCGVVWFNVKKTINRVRKGSDFETSNSAVDWVLRTRTFAKVIDAVNESCGEPPRKRVCKVKSLTVQLQRSNLLAPTHDMVEVIGDGSFSPLRRLLFICNRSYMIVHI